MQSFTAPEIADWLNRHQIVANPYRSEWPDAIVRVPTILQVRLPLHRSLALASLIDCLLEGDALLHITDWGLYTEDEMVVVQSIRRSHGETRLLIDAPGHLFKAGERDLLVGLTSLVKYFCWTAYLYAASGNTLLAWEGEILDFWLYGDSMVARVKDVVSSLNLEIIEGEADA